ncbi:MAG: FAD binding domain-containing protein [Alphaproteobacteria bacterium]|nr:FAD binding domain-containing protein [Alphaproteobacteria bacterium]
MKPVDFDYAAAETVDHALSQLSSTDIKVISGGQSLGPMLNLRLVRPTGLVGLAGTEALRRIEDGTNALTLGAALRHAEFEDGKVPDPAGGMMRYVAGGIAHRAVRTRGTIGGSLAHADPAADWVTTLTTLDAVLTLRNAEGSREVAMTDFMQGAFTTALRDGEIIEAVRIPKRSDMVRWGYYKICRKVGEFAEAIGALVVDPEQRYCRVVMGATDGAPVVLDGFSRQLAKEGGKALSKLSETVRAALPDATPVSHRQHEVALRRAIQQVYPS